MKIKTITDPKPLKKYRGKRKRPEHGLIVLVREKDNYFVSHLSVYNAEKDEYWRIYDEVDPNIVIHPSNVKYWFVEICGKRFYEL